MRLEKVKFQKSTGILVFLLLLALLSFMVAGCSGGGGEEKKEGSVTEGTAEGGHAEGGEEAEAEEEAPEEIKDATVLYVNNCGACHGHDGSGVVGPSIRGTARSVDEVEEVINNGKGTMPKFKGGELTDEQIKIIANYVKNELK